MLWWFRWRPSAGDIEIIRQAELAKEREAKDMARTAHRRQVLDFIRKHPGHTKNAIRESLGSVAGIDEWIRDGILIQKNSGIYLA